MNNKTEELFISIPESQQSATTPLKLKDSLLTTTQDVADFSTVCRTCATVTEFVIPIFDGEGLQNNLAEKIHKHLPIQVRETDVLPRVLCYQCANTLLAWHELVQCCAQADAALRTRLVVCAAAATISADNPPRDKLLESKCGRQETLRNSENDQQNKSVLNLCTLVKLSLTEYYPTLLMNEDNLDIHFVCQKCDSLPASNTIQQLADHLTLAHHPEIDDASAVREFINNYVTFEEALMFEDSDSDVQSDHVEKTSDRDEESETMEEQPDVLPSFFCPFCKSVFSSTARLVLHLNQHIEVSLDNGVTCCENTYKDKKMLVNHLQESHVSRVLSTTETNCRTCGFEAEELQDLKEHIFKEHTEIKCSEIAKKEKEPSAKNQKYIPAVCPECNKAFSNKYNMFAHMKSHEKVTTKFSCDKCNKAYSNQGSLTNHKKLAHEGVLKFVCYSCGEAFPLRMARDVHARLHSGDTPFQCKFCKKSFRAKNTLDRHLEMHLDIRKFACHLCPKRYRKSSHLKSHLHTHQRDKE